MADSNIVRYSGSRRAFWNGLDLGYTLEGIRAADPLVTVPIMHDGLGDHPATHITKAGAPEISMALSDLNLTNIALVPGVTVVNGKVNVAPSVGEDLRELAEEMILKPFINKQIIEDDKRWITIPLCSPPVKAWEHAFDHNNQISWAFTFYPYVPDLTPGTDSTYIYYGNEVAP